MKKFGVSYCPGK